VSSILRINFFQFGNTNNNIIYSYSFRIILVDKENTLKIADFSSSKKMPELNTESVAQTRFSLSLYRVINF